MELLLAIFYQLDHQVINNLIDCRTGVKRAFEVAFSAFRVDDFSIIKKGCAYRGTSLIRNRLPVEPYSRAMPRALWWSHGGGRFFMSEVLLSTGRGGGGVPRRRVDAKAEVANFAKVYIDVNFSTVDMLPAGWGEGSGAGGAFQHAVEIP